MQTETEAPLMNTTEARTETGEIKDQGSPNQTAEVPSEAQPTDPAPEAAKAPAGVPEKYEFAAPEGVTLDPATIEAATPIFKELGLDQAAAQKLVDFQSKLMADATKTNLDAAEKMRTEWRAQVTADKDIGGKLPEVKATVATAIDSLGAEAAKSFREALDLTGAGDHPAIIKGLFKWAQDRNEGTHVSGGAPSKHGQVKPGTPDRPSPAQAMYPSLPA